MLKLLEPTIDEVVTGELKFSRYSRCGASGLPVSGLKQVRSASDKLHLKRGDEIVANPVIKTMMHGKQETDSIKAKNEGGLTFRNKNWISERRCPSCLYCGRHS